MMSGGNEKHSDRTSRQQEGTQLERHRTTRRELMARLFLHVPGLFHPFSFPFFKCSSLGNEETLNNRGEIISRVRPKKKCTQCNFLCLRRCLIKEGKKTLLLTVCVSKKEKMMTNLSD